MMRSGFSKRSLAVWLLLALAPIHFSVAQRMYPFVRTMDYRTLDSSGSLESRTESLRADSGSIVVPENRGAHDGRRIHIPIVRILSPETTSPIPVFWLGGGPGQSNMSTFQYDYFLDHHDQVMVGYRGVDGEISLDCPEVVRALQETGDILGDEALAGVSRAFGACAGRLLSEGIDLSAYTVADAADDLEDARKVLGYDAIDIVSESYGTRLAYIYALRYPDRLHRLIMLGANPPGGMVWDPRLCDSLLIQYGELWKKDPEARAIAPDLVEVFKTVNADFPKRWLFFPIHEGTVKAAVNAFLMHEETAAQVFDAYAAAANGDASGLWMFSFIGGRVFPDIVHWGENAAKAVSLDFDSTRDYIHELNPPGSLIGAPLGAFLWAPAQKGSWPVSMAEERLRKLQRCDVPTLFLSGSLDFSTPAVNVERLFVPNFPRGHHVILHEAGHVNDLWQTQPAATRRILTAFLEQGEIDTSLVRYTPVSFHVGFGFPLMAKLAVGIAIVVLVAVGWGIWALAAGIRRRRNGGNSVQESADSDFH